MYISEGPCMYVAYVRNTVMNIFKNSFEFIVSRDSLNICIRTRKPGYPRDVFDQLPQPHSHIIK